MSEPPEDPAGLVAAIGVSRSWALWLTKTFELRSARDLAALSPADIQAMMRAETAPPARRPTRQVIEGWVRTAQDMSGAKGPSAAEGRPEGGEEGAPRDLGDETPGPSQTAAAEDVPPEAEVGKQGALGPVRPPTVVGLRGTITDAGEAESLGLIHSDQPWFVTLEWKIEGGVPPEGHEWLLQVALRPLGPGRRASLTAEAGRNMVRTGEEGVYEPASYRYRFQIPARGMPSSETPYVAMALLMYRAGSQTRPSVAGSADLGTLRFDERAVPAGGSTARSAQPNRMRERRRR